MEDKVEKSIGAVLKGLCTAGDAEARSNPAYQQVRQVIASADGPEAFSALFTFGQERVVTAALEDQLGTRDWLILEIWRNWNYFKVQLSGLCETLYGSSCCVDKARFLLNCAIAWRKEGVLPVFVADDYRHPSSCTPKEWMSLVEAIGRMRHGNVAQFLHCYGVIKNSHAIWKGGGSAGGELNIINIDIAVYGLWEQYVEEAMALAKRLFQEKVKPFCDARGWNFIAGNGDWWLGPQGAERGGVDLGFDHPDDFEIQELKTLLDMPVPGMPSDCIGTLMPCYDGTHKDVQFGL